MIVLNPNENYLEVAKSSKSSTQPPTTEPSDEPAEKKERKDDKEGKKRREFYEKYRNPQKETETERIPIRVCRFLFFFFFFLQEGGLRSAWNDMVAARRGFDAHPALR